MRSPQHTFATDFTSTNLGKEEVYMATTTTYHAQLIKYTASGDQYILNLKNTGDDVSISRSSNGNLPTSVTSAQTLANALGSLAFKSSISASNIASGEITTSLNITAAGKIADASALKVLNDKITTNANNISKLNSNLAAKANKYKKVDITLSSSSWTGSDAPYIYTCSVSGVTPTNDVNVVLNSTDTNIANAWMDLSVVCGTQSSNSLTLYAYGKKPSVNIPISVLVGDEVIV